MKDGSVAEYRTGLVFDERMCDHVCFGHPESPDRIRRIWAMLESMGLVARCLRLPSRDATDEELRSVHSEDHLKKMKLLLSLDAPQLAAAAAAYNSIYFSQGSYQAALLSCGSLLSLTEAVVQGKVRNGAAVIRPPGHHAEEGCAMGFCLFNNVAVVARVAREKWGVKRVLIVDWDVHHGNGTQHMFYEDPTVLYFSAHRHERGMFYPGGPEGDSSYVGEGAGKGFNINVPWNTRDVGDMEYLLAFHRVLMPVATHFNPDLVLISAGFDAALGDPLGGCKISPAGYGHMTQMLCSLAGGRVVVALEGGYNLSSISASMAACVEVLLGDPPSRELATTSSLFVRNSALVSIERTISDLAPHWPGVLGVIPTPASKKEKPEEDVLATMAASLLSLKSDDGKE